MFISSQWVSNILCCIDKLPVRKHEAVSAHNTWTMKANIHYSCTDRDIIAADAEKSILDLSIENGIAHWRECGGHGRCTTCRIRILHGRENVSEPTATEKQLASDRGWGSDIRLACQTRPLGDVTLERLVRNGADTSQLQTECVNTSQGKETNLAILFCDMRNFTPFAESHPSYDVVHILNRLFAVLGEPILLNNGIIYQYVGDEITGLFGLDDSPPQLACTNAVRAALAMVDGLERLNRELVDEFGIRVAVGIGVHYGSVVAGRIGHPMHKQFSVIGDSINAASRIQGLTRSTGTTILLSDAIVDLLPPDSLAVGKTLKQELRGKRDPIRIAEITGFSTFDPFLIAQMTVERLLATPNEFSQRFYDRVFESAPEVRSLFNRDIGMQGEMLEHMLRGIVYALGRPEHLSMGLHSLGKRHVGYGVLAEHYAFIRGPLLETIAEMLGDDCTQEVDDAWQHAIDLVLTLMQRGTAQSQVPADV